MLTLDRTNFTDPSQNKMLAPPAWKEKVSPSLLQLMAQFAALPTTPRPLPLGALNFSPKFALKSPQPAPLLLVLPGLAGLLGGRFVSVAPVLMGPVLY